MSRALMVSCAVVVATGCGGGSESSAPPTAVAGDPGIDILGAWKVAADDDRPAGDIPQETLAFLSEGRAILQMDTTIFGRYEIESDTLTIVMPVNGREIGMRRRFELDGDSLRMANEKSGFVHYARVEATPPEWQPTAGWQSQNIGFFAVQYPAGWQVRLEKPDADGNQRLQLVNGDGTKSVTASRMPTPAKPTDAQIAGVLQSIGTDILAAASMDGVEMVLDETGELLGHNGVVMRAQTQPPQPEVALLARPLGDRAVLTLFVMFTEDRLDELRSVLDTLEIADTAHPPTGDAASSEPAGDGAASIVEAAPEPEPESKPGKKKKGKKKHKRRGKRRR